MEFWDALEDSQYLDAVASIRDGPKPICKWDIPTEEELDEWERRVRARRTPTTTQSQQRSDEEGDAAGNNQDDDNDEQDLEVEPLTLDWYVSFPIGFFFFSSFVKEQYCRKGNNTTTNSPKHNKNAAAAAAGKNTTNGKDQPAPPNGEDDANNHNKTSPAANNHLADQHAFVRMNFLEDLLRFQKVALSHTATEMNNNNRSKPIQYGQVLLQYLRTSTTIHTAAAAAAVDEPTKPQGKSAPAAAAAGGEGGEEEEEDLTTTTAQQQQALLPPPKMTQIRESDLQLPRRTVQAQLGCSTQAEVERAFAMNHDPQYESNPVGLKGPLLKDVVKALEEWTESENDNDNHHTLSSKQLHKAESEPLYYSEDRHNNIMVGDNNNGESRNHPTTSTAAAAAGAVGATATIGGDRRLEDDDNDKPPLTWEEQLLADEASRALHEQQNNRPRPSIQTTSSKTNNDTETTTTTVETTPIITPINTTAKSGVSSTPSMLRRGQTDLDSHSNNSGTNNGKKSRYYHGGGRHHHHPYHYSAPFSMAAATTTTVMMDPTIVRKVQAIVYESLKRDYEKSFLHPTNSKQYKRMRNFFWYQDRRVVYEDFYVMRVLGRGGFGVVSACQKGTTGKLYAMKVMSKRRIKMKKSVQFVMNERKALAAVAESPFIINLKYSLHSEDEVYLILDLMSGGDLGFHLHQKRKFGPNQCLYYAARIMLGLQALHDKGYAYRDLKPENCLLSEDGRVKLTDLGLTTKTTPTLPSGVVGTRGYWAPEMHKRDESGKRVPYNHVVDWFSFGCCLAEFISGKNPFRSQAAFRFGVDRGEKAKEKALDCAIREWEPEFNPDDFAPDAADLCRRLLDKDPTSRLGAHGGCEEIMAHPWFKTADWESIITDRKKPPFVPPKDVNAASQHEIGSFADDNSKASRDIVFDDADEEVYKSWDWINPKAFATEVIEFLVFERELGRPLLPESMNADLCCCNIL